MRRMRRGLCGVLCLVLLLGLVAAAALAEEAGYGPELVLSAAKDRLQSAVERDYAYFEALSFTVTDSAALAITNQTAAALLDSAAATPASWEGIRGLLLAE